MKSLKVQSHCMLLKRMLRSTCTTIESALVDNTSLSVRLRVGQAPVSRAKRNRKYANQFKCRWGARGAGDTRDLVTTRARCQHPDVCMSPNHIMGDCGQTERTSLTEKLPWIVDRHKFNTDSFVYFHELFCSLFEVFIVC